MPEASPDQTPYRMDGELTIQFAAEHRLALLAVLEDTPHHLTLDLSGIEACDSSGVQLLLALRRSLNERQQQLQISAASTSVQQALSIYGLDFLKPH
jgi:anti-sigma B factor antagonist